ncbi:D-alanyl-D-alanine carboxypeptidase family protein [Bacillus sp. HMF5848]|uniref:M15 family metallopeptidase n=1 Tax=Bacillus sp. HMF5848 TaxID=2495421 RepID=UPI000F7B5393|nr:M15 family metallopeptidase [Bacillus sp. HMF5848]RSK27270.1 D-alanyl-D-alanine carboxypeptidase family protein [Bacillus sp. HMF5848]
MKHAIIIILSLILLTSCGEQSNQNKIESESTRESTHKNVEPQEQADKKLAIQKKDENIIDLSSSEKEASEEQNDQFVLAQEQINVVDEFSEGIKVILNPDNLLSLVNKTYSLSAEYKPGDLVIPNIEFIFGDLNIEKRYLRKPAAEAIEQLINAAKQEDIVLLGVSGYRSYKTQDYLYNNEVNTVGEEAASVAVALPGNSEHQTGLAIDISGSSVGYKLTQELGNVKEGQWVRDNAHKYGFIVRYPLGKEDITGYKYEPWHLRYVGIDAATYMFKNGLTFEEFMETAKKL